MKRIWLIPITGILSLAMCCPTLSWAQKMESELKHYLGSYQVQAYCTLAEEDWHEECHSYAINLDPVDEGRRIFRFYLPRHGINDSIEILLRNDNVFRFLTHKFVKEFEGDTVEVTYIGGQGNLRNDSILMQYSLTSTIAYGTLVCDCKGVRLDVAVETPLDNPASFWRLSPQPATEHVRAVCEASADGTWHSGRWRLVDAAGKALRVGVFTDGCFEISLSDCPAGLYFIEITATDGTACRLKCLKAAR